MKKQLTLLALPIASIILMASCTSQSAETKSSSKPVIDTVKLKDSLAKVELKKADENKVIGDIEFGITEKVFDKQSAKFIKSLTTEINGYVYKLGNYQFRKIEGSFEDSKLYRANVIGYLQHYEEYESNLIPQVETLKTMLVGKYGDPSERNGAPAWHTTQNGYSYLAYRWEIGSKTIEIRVTDRELYYTADLEIYQPKIQEAIAQRAIKKDMEIADAAKDVL